MTNRVGVPEAVTHRAESMDDRRHFADIKSPGMPSFENRRNADSSDNHHAQSRADAGSRIHYAYFKLRILRRPHQLATMFRAVPTCFAVM